MIKKGLIGMAAIVAVGTFVFGTDLFSYARTAGQKARNAVRSEINLEFEIDRAGDMVEDLLPEISESKTLIAEQVVDQRRMQEALEAKESRLRNEELAIRTLRDDLTSGADRFEYRHVSYSRTEVERDLAARLVSCKAARDAVDIDRQILNSHAQKLAANQEKLENMLVEKQKLVAAVAQLDARLNQQQAQMAVSSLEIDDSKFNKARTLIDELNRQLDIQDSLLDAEAQFGGRIPVGEDAVDTGDVLADVDAYFGEAEAKVAEVNDHKRIDVDTSVELEVTTVSGTVVPGI